MRLASTLLCRVIRSTSSHHRPWHIAMAITAGALLGILPKTSLLFALVGLVCFVIPAHLPLLAMIAVVISFTLPLLQSTLGQIGLWSLTHPNLTAYWMRLDRLPLVPWLGIHNTVVNGSLFAWLIVSVPLYLSSRLATQTLFAAAIPDEIADIMLTADDRSPVIAVGEVHEIRPLAGLREPGPAQPRVEPPVVIWDDLNQDRYYFALDSIEADATGTEAQSSDQVIRRSAQLAAWAEELITEELLMDDQSRSENPADLHQQTDVQSEASADDEERWLIETTIEMVRIAEQAVTNQAAMKSKQTGDAQDVSRSDSPTQESLEIQSVQSENTAANGNEVVSPESSIRREQMPHSDHRSHLGQTRAGMANASSSVVNRPREEALHYLLRHLKGVQEKAQKQ